MEVYEKSLKEAQRNLLRKAQWGEGIQPQPEGQQEVTSQLSDQRLCMTPPPQDFTLISTQHLQQIT